MNILVVDDDKLVRLFLKSLLTKTIPCTIAEAENGLDAMLYLEENPVDLVLMDISMPILDGHELLSAIRSTSSISSIPVIVMSSSDEKNTVTKLIQLGISDYILKPFKNGAEISKRISRVIALSKEKEYENNKNKVDPDSKKLLLIDKDINFRTFFQSVFSDRFSIIDAESAVLGLKTSLQVKPDIVIICEGLTGLNEQTLAMKIRTTDTEKRVKIFLCHDTQLTDAQLKDFSVFDGYLKKSYVPNVMDLQIMTTVLNEQTAPLSLLDILKNQLNPELISSIRQTFGVISSQEVMLLPQSEISGIKKECMATINLFNSDDNIIITLGMTLSAADLASLTAKIGDNPEILALTTLTDTVAGRICSSLLTRGFKFEKQQTKIDRKFIEFDKYPTRLLYPFRTESGENFIISLFMVK